MISRHKVNLDAIRAGARGLFESYPRDPEPPRPPGRAHAVLWQDDWWRGVDMARASMLRAYGQEPHEKLIRPQLDVILGKEPATSRAAIGWLSEQDYEDIDVLSALMANLVATGDPDRGVKLDLEDAAEERTPG